ncbi:MAG: hypothetical protein WD048_04550 [Chitinophagales bacterium]
MSKRNFMVTKLNEVKLHVLAVDEFITAQAEKTEQLQQYKKGLIQGLFPEIV